MKYILIFIAFVAISGTVIYQGVRTDATMTGTGITGDELKVDTSRVATRYYVDAGSVGGTPSATTISPAQITADQDNYNPTAMGKATYVRLDGDNGIRAITGIADSVAGTLEKTLLNIGSYPIYLPMDHPDSDAAHRFKGWPSDYILYPGRSVKIWYDLTATRWRLIGDNNDAIASVYHSVSAGNATAGDWGNLGLNSIVSGTNTATAATTTMPAAWVFSTAAASTNGFEAHFTDAANQFTAFASAHIFTQAYISIPTLSDGTETYTIELQLTPSPTLGTLEQNNTIGLRYSNGVNTGKWELFSQDNAAAEDVADSGITVAANTRYKLRIEMDKSKTEARAYIDGVYVGKVETQLPNSVAISARIILLKSAGTTARTMSLHSFSSGAIYP